MLNTNCDSASSWNQLLLVEIGSHSISVSCMQLDSHSLQVDAVLVRLWAVSAGSLTYIKLSSEVHRFAYHATKFNSLFNYTMRV